MVAKTNPSKRYLAEAERRFKNISNINEDLSVYPLRIHRDKTSVDTDKSKSKEFGEVFTPLWLADRMLKQAKINTNSTTLDLCAGYGQFTIRLLRKLYNKKPDEFSFANYLVKKHSFSELQLTSCYKLLKIFTTNINLFIGDAKELPKLPGIACGIWCYIDSMSGWVPITATINAIMHPVADSKCTEDCISEDKFVEKLQAVINSINEGYKTMQEETLSSHDRLDILNRLNELANEKHPKDKSVRTPKSIVDKLLSCVDDLDKKKILVLFNAEIVEELIHNKKIDPKNIIFGVDDADNFRAVFVKKHYSVDSCIFPNKDPKSICEFLDIKRMGLGIKQWDVVLSNPSYNDKLDLKIVGALVNAHSAKEYVIVHPSAWILDRKGVDKQFKSFKETVEGKIKSIALFNGNAVFDIQLWYPCVITHIVEEHTGNISANYFNKRFTMASIAEEVRYGDNWNTIVSPFMKNIKIFINTYGSVWDNNRKKIDAEKYYAQFSAVRGHVIEDHLSSMYKDDFYTTVRKDADLAKSITKKMDNRPGPTFQFNTSVERDNFVDYLKTDFARFCLSLLKISQNTYYGEMGLIPWLDFTKSWDDEKLFEKFNVNQETQNYIRSFLPDYYGIRKLKGEKTSMEEFKAKVIAIRSEPNYGTC